MKERKLSITDKILGVLISMKDEHNLVRISRLELQKFLYEHRRKKEFQNVFPEVGFDTRDVVPLSEEIEYGFNSLIFGRLMEQHGARSNVYYITNGAIKYYNTIKNQFDEEIQSLLR